MKMTPTRRLALIALRQAGSPLTLVGLAARTGAKVSTLEAYGRDLAREGHIIRFKVSGQTMFGLPGRFSLQWIFRLAVFPPSRSDSPSL